MNDFREHEGQDTEKITKQVEKSKKPKNKKYLNRYRYKTQSVETPSRIFGHNLSKELGQQESLIGVLLENGTIAWSFDMTRHIDFESAEESKTVARVQTNFAIWSRLPPIQVHGLNIESIKKLSQYIIDSNTPNNSPIEITLVNDFESGGYNQGLYNGVVGKLELNNLEEIKTQ